MEPLNNFSAPSMYSESSRMGQQLRAANQLGSNYDNELNTLINLYNNPSASTGQVQAATLRFEKTKALLEMFSTMMRSMFDTMMSIIRKLAN